MNSSFHNLPHHNRALTNTKIQRFLTENFIDEERLAAYGAFWIVMEMFHKEKNKITNIASNEELLNYIKDFSFDFFVKVIDSMIGSGLLEKDEIEGYYFSPYQRLVKTTKEKHSENLRLKNQKLQNVINEQDKLINRLNEKIDFLKSKNQSNKEILIKTKF